METSDNFNLDCRLVLPKNILLEDSFYYISAFSRFFPKTAKVFSVIHKAKGKKVVPWLTSTIPVEWK